MGSRGRHQSVSFVNRHRGRWSSEWQLHRDKHSEHCHLHHMSGLHLYQGLMFCRSVCRKVSVCGHADTGGGLFVCVCCVHLFVGLLNAIKTGRGIFWKWNMTGLDFYRKRNCVELLERGHLLPTYVFLFFLLSLLVSLVFSSWSHRASSLFMKKGHAGIKLSIAFFFVKHSESYLRGIKVKPRMLVQTNTVKTCRVKWHCILCTFHYVQTIISCKCK